MASGAAVFAGFGHQLVVQFESFVLGTGAKQLRLAAVTLPADESDGIEPGWRGTMVSVAIVTGRRAEIFAFEQCRRVHARPPAGVGIDRNRQPGGTGPPGHPLRVAMANVARFGDSRRVDARLRAGDAAHRVHRVAVGARRDAVVSGVEGQPVLAGPVLSLLVDARSGVEAAHVDGVGMASPAKARNRVARRSTEVGGVLRVQILGEFGRGVAAVTVVTGDPGLGVNVGAEIMGDGGIGFEEVLVTVTQRARGLFDGAPRHRDKCSANNQRREDLHCRPPFRGRVIQPRPAINTSVPPTMKIGTAERYPHAVMPTM